MKHVPERSCIVCKAQRDKSELLRIVKTPEGEVVIDTSGKKAGRGAYVCRCKDCVFGMIKKRALNRSFKTELSPEVYAALERQIEGLEL